MNEWNEWKILSAYCVPDRDYYCQTSQLKGNWKTIQIKVNEMLSQGREL